MNWHDKSAVVCGLTLLFCFEYSCTRERNRVWQTDLSLWSDAVAKSPENGRGLMNLGVELMKRGKFDLAGYYFERAKLYAPDYSVLEVNLGVLAAARDLRPEAEFHFKQALRLNPNSRDSYFFYASWLDKWGRKEEAVDLLRK